MDRKAILSSIFALILFLGLFSPLSFASEIEEPSASDYSSLTEDLTPPPPPTEETYPFEKETKETTPKSTDYWDYFNKEKEKEKSGIMGNQYFSDFRAGIPDWKVGPSSLLLLEGLSGISDHAGEDTKKDNVDALMAALKVRAEEDHVDYLSSLKNGGQVYIFTYDNGKGPAFSLDNNKSNSVNFWLSTLRPKVSSNKFLQISKYIQDQIKRNPHFQPVFMTDKILAEHFNTGEEFFEEIKFPDVLPSFSGQKKEDACLGVYYPPEKGEDAGEHMIQIEGVYATMLEITPVVPQGFSSLSASEKAEWKRTHQAEFSKPRLTTLGKVVEKAKASGILTAIKESGPEQSKSLMEQLKNTADVAINSSDGDEGFLELSPENQKGLARGGVFTVTRLVKRIRITYDGDKVVTRTFACQPVFSHYIVDSEVLEACKDREPPQTLANRCFHKKYRPVYRAEKSEPNINTEDKRVEDEFMSKDPYAYKLTVSASQNWEPESSYQIISVRCNKAETKSRIEYAEGQVLQDGEFITVGVSQIVKGEFANFFNDIPVSFIYSNKDCKEHMTCTTNPRQALKDSDGDSNIQDLHATDGAYGASLSGINSNKFQLKKDKKARVLRLDVPVPASIGNFDELVLPVRVAATGIARRPLDSSQGDGFAFLDGDKEPIFKSSLISEILLDGEANRFYVGHTGGGEVAENYKFEFKYYTFPEIIAKIPLKFTGDGIIETKNVSESILMSCPVVFSEKTNRGIFIENTVKEELPPATGFKNDAEREQLTITYSDVLK